MTTKTTKYQLSAPTDQWAKCLALWKIEGRTAADKLRSFIAKEAKRFDTKFNQTQD